MPTSTLIKQICTVDDDCDINSPPLDLSVIGIDKTFIHWYHDVSYGSDEYGCTSLPNIFHVWLIDRNGNHVNVTGNECTPYWGWGRLKSLYYDGSKWYILWAGVRYTSANTGYPFIMVIDLSNPDSPSTTILQGSSTISSPSNIIVNIQNGKVVYSQHNSAAYIFDFNDLLTASSLDDVLANAIAINVGVGHHIGLLGSDKIVIVDNNRNWYIYDYSGTQLYNGTLSAYPDAPIPIYYQGTQAVWVWRIDQSSATIIKDDGTTVTKSVTAYTGDTWKFGVYAIGVKMFIAIEPAGEGILYDPINDVMTTGIPVDCPIISFGKPNNMVCVDKIVGYANFKKFVPDSYFIVSVNGNKVTVTDSAGNPLSGKTVYMWKLTALTNLYAGIDNTYQTATTDANGQVTIPFSGVVAIAVP